MDTATGEEMMLLSSFAATRQIYCPFWGTRLAIFPRGIGLWHYSSPAQHRGGWTEQRATLTESDVSHCLCEGQHMPVQDLYSQPQEAEPGP